MKIGYYPGCSLEGTSKEYNQSLLAIADACGIEMVEIKDWNCCGATAAHSLNHKLSNFLPSRNLVLATEQGLAEVVVPCASCYSRLMATQQEMVKTQPSAASLKLLNVLEFIQKYIAPALKDKQLQLVNAKLACYYGCLLVRPAKMLNVANPEDPTVMEEVVTQVGAQPVDWPFKVECCGAGLSISRTDLVAKLSANIMEDASHRGAEAVVVACPMCHSNLDMRRGDINKLLEKNVDIPVLFITQVIGLALGLSPKKLGITEHFVSAKKFMAGIATENKTIKQA